MILLDENLHFVKFNDLWMFYWTYTSPWLRWDSPWGWRSTHSCPPLRGRCRCPPAGSCTPWVSEPVNTHHHKGEGLSLMGLQYIIVIWNKVCFLDKEKELTYLAINGELVVVRESNLCFIPEPGDDGVTLGQLNLKTDASSVITKQTNILISKTMQWPYKLNTSPLSQLVA